jgi:hypothetical protein
MIIISTADGLPAAGHRPGSSAQADALAAACAFARDAGIPDLTIGACDDGEIRIIVSDRSGPPAARIHAVAALAGRAGAACPVWDSLTSGLYAGGTLGGHRLTIAAFITDPAEGAQP